MSNQPDFIVIGSGIAGVRAAIELSRWGQVAVLTKSRADESNTEYAQGGIAVVLNDEDEIGLHQRDTLLAGDGLCDENAVRILVEEGPARIEELISWGAAFDREGLKLAFTREAAHSRKRILHAGGDSTGQEINRTLIRKVRSLENAQLYPHCFALDLITGRNGCTGVRYIEQKSRNVRQLSASGVLLATGGLGKLFRETTNPDVATGDGYAMALRSGAQLADMEFIQFHPTALQLPQAPTFLLSEALRGEGAWLRNHAGERFMARYHHQAELAPRDVVSRAIFEETSLQDGSSVFLDLTHLDAAFVRRRFPRIYQTCKGFGLDLTTDRIPVFPAAHYMMGGVYTDLNGQTTVARLFAAGEVACNGVHGANRLASNSLLDGLVYGYRAARAMVSSAAAPSLPGSPLTSPPTAARRQKPINRSQLQKTMTEKVGIVRNLVRLEQAMDQIGGIPANSRRQERDHELVNLVTTAGVMAHTALLRKESRGGHYRSDYPESTPEWKCHILSRLRSNPRELEFTRVETLQKESDRTDMLD